MAQIEQEILIDIKLEGTENDQKIDELTKSLTELTKANKDLQTENAKLAKSGQENSKAYLDNAKQIEINKQKIQENAASRKGLVQSIIAEDNSVKALSIRNAELIKQRNLINTGTVEGRSRIAAINAELDKNNKVIRENVSHLEKQKINIGNYASALDDIVPGLGGFISRIQMATKAGLQFIATPIGLVIAAIGLALGSLAAYFRGSEEGQNRLNKIMAIGSAILEQFMNVAEEAGKVIFDAISNPKQAIIDFGNLIKENIINRFEGILEFIPAIGKSVGLLFRGEFKEAGQVAFDAVVKVTTGVENATAKIAGFVEETVAMVERGIDFGKRLADLQASIDRKEREQTVERARINLEVAKLREQAITLEGDAKRQAIKEAIRLETLLSDKEMELANLRLAQAQLKVKANGDDKDALKEVADATAKVIEAEQLRFDNTVKFRKQLDSLDEEEEKKRLEQLKARQETIEGIQKDIEDRNKAQKKTDEENAKRRVDIEKSVNKQLSDAALKLTKDKIDINKLAQNFFKEGAAKETVINTKAAAMAAYKALASIPIVGPVLGGIAYAAILVKGLAEAAGIRAIPFARGGLTGKRIGNADGMPISRSNGDNLLATVRTGEVILNRDQQSRLGGDSTFRKIGVPGFATGGLVANETRIATQQAQQQIDLNQMAGLINQVQTVLILEELQSKQRDSVSVQRRARII